MGFPVFGTTVPTLKVGSDFKDFHLKDYAVYLKDSTKSLTLLQAVDEFSKGKGALSLYAVPNLGFEDANHWILVNLKNVTDAPKDLVFELDFPYTYLDDLSFFLLQKGIVKKTAENLSWHSSKSALELPNRNPAFPMALLPGETCTLVLKIWKKDGVLITPLKIQSKREFLVLAQYQQIMNGLVSGMQLLAILVGICFFVLSRQRLYLYYAVYVFGITGFVLADQGQLNIYFLGKYDMLAGPNSWAIFTLIAVASHTFFTIRFLDIRKEKYPFLIYTSWLLNAASLAFSFSLAIGFQLTDLTYQIALIIVLVYVLLVFVYLIIGLASRLAEAYLYLGAVSTFFFTVIMICLAKLDIIPEYQFVINLLHYSPLLEVCILCMGLVYRFHNAQTEKIMTLMEISTLRNNITRAVIQTQESERQRISQDLHDDVGNTLAAAKGIIGTIVSRVSEPSISRDFRNAYTLVDKAGVDLRSITHNLMPVDFEKYKLTEILKQTVAQLNEVATIRFQYLEQGIPKRFSPEKELMMYRIVGELTSNVLRHAQARNAIIQVLFQDHVLVISVEDDGVSNSVEKNNGEKAGIGLKNVSSRAMYIQAALSVDMHQNGTCVILEVPYE